MVRLLKEAEITIQISKLGKMKKILMVSIIR